MTALERKTAREAAEAQAAQERQAAAEAYERRRPGEFAKLMNKAMRVALLAAQYPEYQEEKSWWFDDFGVDAHAQTFSLETMSGHSVTEANLHPSDVSRLNSALDLAIEWLDTHLQAKESARLAAIEREARRKAALEKLTPADREVLGLR